MDDMIYRRAAIEAIETKIKKWNTVDGEGYHVGLGLRYTDVIDTLTDLPSAQPEPFVDADKLKRCRFEYINACKTVTYPTPDTRKNDIYDAYAVIKALHPIFGDEEF